MIGFQTSNFILKYMTGKIQPLLLCTVKLVVVRLVYSPVVSGGWGSWGWVVVVLGGWWCCN